MDRLDVHCFTIDVLEDALQHKIHFVGLPSNTSHFLQPLDVSVFMPFKSKLRHYCNELTKANDALGQGASLRQVAAVVDITLRVAITGTIIRQGALLSA